MMLAKDSPHDGSEVGYASALAGSTRECLRYGPGHAPAGSHHQIDKDEAKRSSAWKGVSQAASNCRSTTIGLDRFGQRTRKQPTHGSTPPDYLLGTTPYIAQECTIIDRMKHQLNT
eukprot:5032512-Amphidinium_carterae.1